MRVRGLALVVTCALVIGGSTPARAATTVGGAINSDTVWDLAGSPYVMTQDVVVQAGATLTIEAGVEVHGTDASANDVELLVRGGLVAVGTEAAPVVFRGQTTGTPGYWQGLRFEAGAAAVVRFVDVLDADNGIELLGPNAAVQTFADVVIRGYRSRGVTTAATTGSILLTNVEVDGTGSSAGRGVSTDGAALELVGGRLHDNTYGVYATDASVGLERVVIDHNTSDGVRHRVNAYSSFDLDVVQCTFYGNPDALEVSRYSDYRTGLTVRIDRSIFGAQDSILRDTGSSSYRVAFSRFVQNVWWGTTQFVGVAPSSDSGNLRYNALLAAPDDDDFEPTDRSPARYLDPADPARTIGAVPHAGTPTGAGVHGFWYVNHVFEALTVTDVAGDVVVAPGVTVTFHPGSEFRMATTDVMQGGLDTARVEVRVEGTLEADGTNSRPVLFRSAAATPAPRDWYGIVIPSNAEAFNVSQVDLGHAYRGVSLYANDHIVAGSTIHHCSDAGVWVQGGTPALEALDLHTNSRGIWIEAGATVDVVDVDVWGSTGNALYVADSSVAYTDGILRDNGGDAIRISISAYTSHTATFRHLTIANNVGDGIEFNRYSDYRTGLVVTLDSCSLTHNGDYAVRDSGSSSYRATFNCQSSNLWGNADGAATGVAGTTGCVAWNPLYVDLDARDYTPTQYSPNRALGVGGTHIGKLPYAGDIGPQIMGFLWDDVTFTAEDSPYTVLGDLYVPAGTTVAFEPGAELVVVPEADAMGGGLSTSRAEIRFLAGSVALFDGTGEPITFYPDGDAPTPGAWYGVRFDDGGASQVVNATIERATYGLWLEGPTAPSVTDTRILFSASAGVTAKDVTGAQQVDLLGVRVVGTGAGTGVQFTDSSGRVRSSYLTHHATGVRVDVSVYATRTVHLINNTIVHQGTGVLYNRYSDYRTGLDIWVANNVIAYSTGYAVRDSSSSSYSANDRVLSNNFYQVATTAGTFNQNTGNITTDPRIEDDDWDTFPRWWDGQVWEESLAINAGSAAAPELPARDILGKARTLGPSVDMGAFEFDVDANREPRADGAAASLMVPRGEVFALDGAAAYDPDGIIAAAWWTMSDGAVTAGQSVTHTFAQEGSRWAYLTVVDDDGAEDHARVDVNVNIRPVADAGPAVYQDEGPDESVFFDGTLSTDPDGQIVAWTWDFGDGTPVSTESSPRHSYLSAGLYTVTLTVRDNEGLTDSDTTLATVYGSEDTVGPLVQHTEVADGRPIHTAVVITADIQDPSGVTSAVVYYRAKGAAGAQFLVMANTGGNSWSATIPAAAVTAAGVEYWFVAVDGVTPDANTSTTPAGAPDAGVFDFLVLGDPDPPAIAHTEVADGQTVGVAVPISATITDATGVAGAHLYFRTLGGTAFGAVAMTKTTGNTWTAQVPGFVVAPPGVAYYLEATDTSPLPNTGRAPAGAPDTLFDFTVGTGDTTPPLIAHTPIGDGQPAGTAVVVTAGIADSGGVAGGTVYYRAADSSGAFTGVAMVRGAGSNWTATIPAGAVAEPGIAYYIAAEDTAGNEAVEPDGAPETLHTFTVTATDTAAPVIDHTPVPDGQLDGVAVTVQATVTDASDLAFVRLHYRPDGFPFYQEALMTEGTPTVYTAAIPGFSVTGTGVEYYVRAQDTEGNTGHHPEGAPDTAHHFTVGDAEPPLLAHAPVPDGQLAGEDVVIDVIAIDPSGVAEVTLHYRAVGEIDFTAVALVPGAGDDDWLGVISGAEVTAVGVEYYLRAVDASPAQNAATSPAAAGSVHRFSVRVPDTTPPAIVHTPIADEQVPGLPVLVSAVVVDDSGVAGVRAYYRAQGATPFTALDLANTGGSTWEASLPGGAVVEPGIEYYLVATDAAPDANEARDPAGAALHEFTVVPPDGEGPAIDHTAVTGLTLGDDLVVEALVSDPAGVAEVLLQWALDGEPFETLPLAHGAGDRYFATVPASAIPAGTGELRYYLEATDALGNTASEPFAGAAGPFHVPVDEPDRTGPTVTIRSIAAPWTAGIALAVEVDAEDASGVAAVTVYYRADGDAGAFVALPTAGADPYTATVPAAAVRAPGLTVYATATDGLGNDGRSADLHVAVEAPADTTPPTVELVPIPQPQAAGTAVVVSAIGADASGVAGVWLFYRGPADGGFGEVAMTAGAGGVWAGTIPAGSVAAPSVAYYVRAVDAAPAANEALAPAGAPGSPAVFTVAAGDSVGPTIAHAQPGLPIYAGDPVLLRATVSDPSGVADVRVFWRTEGAVDFAEVALGAAGGGYEGTVGPVAAPAFEYYLRAEDGLGNVTTDPAGAPGTLRTRPVTVRDVVGPVIQHTPVADGQRPGVALVIEATINDDPSGVATALVHYRRVGTATDATIALADGGDGAFFGVIPAAAVVPPGIAYSIEAVDGADPANTARLPEGAPTERFTFTVAEPQTDAEPPAIDHTPVTAEQPAGVAVGVTATVTDDSGVGGVTLRYRTAGEGLWRSVALAAAGDVWSGEIPAPAVAAPGVDYYLVAWDRAPAVNTGTAPVGAPLDAWSFPVEAPDEEGPAVSVAAVTSPQLAGTAVELSATATDPAGVAAVTLYYGLATAGSYAALPLAAAGADGWTGAIPAAAVTPGTMRYYVSAVDALGNEALAPAGGSTAPLTFEVVPDVVPDTTPPVIRHTPLAGGLAVGAAVAVAAEVTDDSGVARVTLHVREHGTVPFVSLALASSADDEWTGSIPGALVGAAGIDYYLEAVDAAPAANAATHPAGAPAAFHTVTAAVAGDTTPPVLVVTAVADDQPEGLSVPVRAAAEDASGVARVTLHYRPSTETTWATVELLFDEDEAAWGADVPAEAVFPPAVDYWVEAVDGAPAANTAVWPAQGAAAPAQFTVEERVGDDVGPGPDAGEGEDVPPAPDAGGGGDDAGPAGPDVKGDATGRPDAAGGDGLWLPDAGDGPDSGGGGTSGGGGGSSGCAAAPAAGGAAPWALLALLLALPLARRRRRAQP